MEICRKYKESGIFWQPSVPEVWVVTRLKHILLKLSRERSPKDELLVCSNSGEVKKRGDSKLGLVAESNDIYQGVKAGDLLVHGMDTWHGAIAVSNYDGMCTPVVHVCDSSQNKKYIALYLRNMANQKIFKLISNGVRQNTSDFRSWDKLGNIPIPLPPLAEQEKIVSYLEGKTSKIDAYVADKETEIELLQELKQKTIADAVTKGLNPDAKMKDSGISWIGEIPEHWEMKQLRSFLTLFTEKGHGDAQLLSVTREQGVIERDKEDKEENHNFVPDDLSGYKYIEKGDFAINKMKAWQGSYAVSEYNGIVSPAYFTCKLKGVNKDFFSKAIRSKVYVPFFTQYSKGIRVGQWDLNPNSLKSIPFFLPPSDEQQTIVAYIEEKCEKIDKLASELQSEIDYLKEYKQRLIADCVTGQVKV